MNATQFTYEIPEKYEDNNVAFSKVSLCIKGDFGCDDVVNISDYFAFEHFYDSTCNDTNYNITVDFDEDCDVDFIDFVWFSRLYGG